MNSQKTIFGTEMAIYEGCRDLVYQIMHDNIKTRNNDFELIFAVWEAQGIQLSPELKEQIKNTYPMETITRARREVQNSWQVNEADPNVQVGRDRQDKRFTNYFKGRK